jgi:predicted nucleic acid-binding protein
VNGIPRVVLDPNLLFPPIGWLGNPLWCVQAARQGKCASLTREPILAELPERLQLKRGFDAAGALGVTDEIRAFSKLVAIPGTLKVVAHDPDDDAVLECAVIGQADHLVSDDPHLLSLGSYQNIQI